jgi:hypothetical protein
MGGASDLESDPEKIKPTKPYKSTFSDLLSVAVSLEKAQRSDSQCGKNELKKSGV